MKPTSALLFTGLFLSTVAPVRANSGDDVTSPGLVGIKPYCAAFSLYYACSYHGVDVTLEDLKWLLPPEDLGVSMLDLKQVAEQVGFEVRALEVSPLDLTRFRGPLIAKAVHSVFKDTVGHFVLVWRDGTRRDGVWIFDPSRPWKKAAFREFKPDSKEDDKVRVAIILLHPLETNAAN